MLVGVCLCQTQAASAEALSAALRRALPNPNQQLSADMLLAGFLPTRNLGFLVSSYGLCYLFLPQLTSCACRDPPHAKPTALRHCHLQGLNSTEEQNVKIYAAEFFCKHLGA